MVIVGEVIDLFTGQERELSPEQRAHLIQRVTDMALREMDLKVEIALLSSERERLEQRLQG